MTHTESVDSDSLGEGCSIVYLEVTREAVLNSTLVIGNQIVIK